MSSTVSKRAATEAFAEPDHPFTARTKRSRKGKRNRQDQKPVENDPSEEADVEVKAGPLVPEKSVTSPQLDRTVDDRHARQHPTSTPTAAQTTPPPRRKARRSKKKKKRNLDDADKDKEVHDQSGELTLGNYALTLPMEAPTSQTQRRHRKREKRAKRLKEHEKPDQLIWNLSPPTAGLFLDQDPILAQNEKYLILPVTSGVHIYATATSLLVRTLKLEVAGTVTSCLLSPSSPSHLFVSTYQGAIAKYDWTTGRKVGFWKCQPKVLRIVGIVQQGDSADQSRLITLHDETSCTNRLVESVLNASSKHPSHEITLLQEMKLLPSLLVLDGARTMVACSEDKIVFGQRGPGTQEPEPAQPWYTWREVSVPGVAISIDARSRQEKNAHGKTSTFTDVVLGFEDGVILIYEDLLSRLLSLRNGRINPEIRSRRLHWHRGAVNAVKWSRDGNYLISGGSETVLVIWQLDTNQQQFLPHLSTSILNIVISARGSSYALRLADNSVMVLSTADLLPSANISGPGLLKAVAGPTVAAIDPKSPNHLLSAIPTDFMDMRKRDLISSATLLQTFDLSTNYQTSRQALARNMTTAFRNGPTGEMIREPDVTHLKISHDGQWLVTVDRWSPAATDVEPLMPTSEASTGKAQLSETCLRFWIWSEENQSWELNTRIDEPHSTGLQTVLLVATHPTKTEVATVGSDGVLKLWKPMARYRDGVAIKNSADQQLFTWSCARSAAIEPDMSRSTPTTDCSAALAYSNDGSVLAASWSHESSGSRTVHFVDSRTTKITLSEANLMSAGHGYFAFAGPSLLILSKHFQIWDTVAMKITFSITLRHAYRGSAGLLAVNEHGGSFALALNREEDNSAYLIVFDTTNPANGPLYKRSLENHVTALLPAINGPGYVVVDSQACTRRLTPPGGRNLTSTLTVAVKEPPMKGLAEVFGSHLLTQTDEVQEAETQARPAPPAPPNPGEKKSLDSVLASLSSGKPLPVAELFKQVASVFARPMVTA